MFVEPTVAMVGLNNRLKLAELQIDREIRTFSKRLTGDVAESPRRCCVQTWTCWPTFDVIAAKARLDVG